MKGSFPHERIEKRWWREWWGEDFSWRALARKTLGYRSAGVWSSLFRKNTLQDYWRLGPAGETRNDGELERQGELVRDPNGNRWHVAHVPMHWSDGSAAKARWNETQRENLKALITHRLLKTEKSSFQFASQPIGADGRAQLQGAIFLDPPSLLDHAAAPLRLKCDLAWLPPWDASGEVFGDGASFATALFNGHTRLQRARFEGCVSFDQARFLGDITCGLTSESGAAQFPGLASFKRAIFLRDAQFDYCTFEQVRFDQAHFAGSFQCFAARLNSSAFDGATFDGPVTFLSSTIKALSFSAAHARGRVDFGSVTMTNTHLFFRSSVFSGPVSFAAAKLPRKIDRQVGGFLGTRFLLPPDFTMAGVDWIAALDGTRFERGVILDKPAPAVAEHEFMSKLLPAALTVDKNVMEPEKRLEEQLNALEGGCRTIRLEAGKIGDSETEQLYARLEAKVREQLRAIPAASTRSHDEEGA